MRLRKAVSLLAVCALFMVSLTLTQPSADAQQNPAANGLVVLESTQSFEETWSALIAALDANTAIRTIAQVDHGASATAADLLLDESRVVFFGNPALGTPLMQASRTAGIDLPQKIHVFQDGIRVFVSYNATSYLSSRHGTGDVATLAKINGALNGLARAATNTEGPPATPSAGATASAAAGLTTTTSGSDFDTTWSQLMTAIDNSPASVAFTVDHGANSAGVLPPTRLVVFGNAAIGTPMMASSPSAGVDLPLKMLVFEDDQGVTHVVSTAPSFVQARHNVGQVPTVAAATGAIANFTAAATAGSGVTPTDGEASGDDEVLGINELAFTGSEPIAVTGAALLISIGGALVVGARRRITT